MSGNKSLSSTKKELKSMPLRSIETSKDWLTKIFKSHKEKQKNLNNKFYHHKTRCIDLMASSVDSNLQNQNHQRVNKPFTDLNKSRAKKSPKTSKKQFTRKMRLVKKISTSTNLTH